MFKRFKAIFAPPAASEADAEAALRRAAAAILAEAGLSDGDFDATEKAVAQAALARLYGLDASAAAALTAEGEAAAREAVDHHRFTSHYQNSLCRSLCIYLRLR